jgi:hypothetical protein
VRKAQLPAFFGLKTAHIERDLTGNTAKEVFGRRFERLARYGLPAGMRLGCFSARLSFREIAIMGVICP